MVLVCLAACNPDSWAVAQCGGSLPVGKYTVHVAFTEDTPSDGGCPATHALDGHTLTVTIPGGGVASVVDDATPLPCRLVIDEVTCALPTGGVLDLFIVGECTPDGGSKASLTVTFPADAGLPDAEPACTEDYRGN
jgi:hypothetical protein